MEHSLCKLCGFKHEGPEHVFEEVAVIPGIVFNALPEISKNVVLLSNPEVKRSVKRWDRDSWNAYMREYMKKHRALKKNA